MNSENVVFCSAECDSCSRFAETFEIARTKTCGSSSTEGVSIWTYASRPESGDQAGVNLKMSGLPPTSVRWLVPSGAIPSISP